MRVSPAAAHGISPSRKPQSRAARRRHAAARVRADPGGRRQRQDARADDPHRVAARHRAGRPAVDPRRHVHEQGGEGDADPARGAHAGEHARHVGRHVPRPVQPDAARAPPRREPAAALPDPRHAGPAVADQADVQGAQPRRRPLSAEAAAVVHREREGGGPAAEHGRGGRRVLAAAGRALRALRRDVPARGRGRLRRAAAAQLRAPGRPRGPARALPAALLAPARRRVPGHEHAAVQVAAHARRRAHGGLRRGRRRPVDLRVPRREGRQHAAVRARLRHARAAGEAHQARAELPLARAHPRRGERAHPAQPGTARQEPLDERGQGRAHPRVRGADRPGRGRVHRRRGEGHRGGRRARSTRSRSSTAPTRSRACSSTRSSAPAFRTASTAACASSSARRSSTRSRTCASSRPPRTTARSCAS